MYENNDVDFIEVTMKWYTYLYYLKCRNYQCTFKYVWVQPYLHIPTVVENMEESGYSEYNDLCYIYALHLIIKQKSNDETK